VIAIVDYGAGNLQSISNAFEAIGAKAKIVNNPSELSQYKAIVVPGVGGFSDCMRHLINSGFAKELEEQVIRQKKPYLGICLGMQFLGEESFEHGKHKGLGWLPGSVQRIMPSESKYKVPHMGWNNVKIISESILFQGLTGPTFYFVHSYHLESPGLITSSCYHGTEVSASVEKGHIFGVQFHPEKSQGAGLKVLENFCRYADA
jgi:glutamine amidotransferase